MDISSAEDCCEQEGMKVFENRVAVECEEAARAFSESCKQYVGAWECPEDCSLEQRKDEGGDCRDKAEKEGKSSLSKGFCNGGAAAVPQHSRPVRFNRGIRRRFPGDEYDELSTSRRRARVRSMSEVCGTSSVQQFQGEVQISQAKRKGRPLKSLTAAKKQLRNKKLQSYTTRNVFERSQAGNTADNFKYPKSDAFRCNEKGCGKVFMDSSALYRHARVHGDRPFVCHYDGCNKRFLERSKLKRHFLIHTGEKSFICIYEGCGKAFSLDFNLRTHMKCHTGQYHECPHEGCEKKYCQNYKLKAHINKKHKEGDAAKDKFVPSSGNSYAAAMTQSSSKKQGKLKLLGLQKDKIQKRKEGRCCQIKELQSERHGGGKKLRKFEKPSEGMSEVRERLEIYGSELLSSVETDSGELLGGEKELLVFAQKLPPRDQGARLVKAAKLQFSCQPQHTVDPTSLQLDDINMENSLAAVKDCGALLSSKMYIPPQVSTASSYPMLFDVQHSVDHNESCIQKHTGDKQEQRSSLSSCFTKSNKPCTSVMSSKFLGCSGHEQDCEERSSNKIQPVASDPDLDRINQHQKFLLSQQSELPVIHLFSFQEQPCLVD